MVSPANNYVDDSDASGSSATGTSRKKLNELSHLLQWVDTFMRAATDLLDILETLDTSSFRLHSLMIIRMVEIAQRTLELNDLALYQFSYCPPHLAQHKQIYYDLLKLIYCQRRLIKDPNLQKRLSRLMLPLKTTFKIDMDEDPEASPSIITSIIKPKLLTCSATEDHTLMPPPDAFSSMSRAQRRKWRLVRFEDSALAIDRERCRYATPPPSPPVRKLGGLWNKQLMSQAPRGRSRAVRPVGNSDD